MAILTAFGGIHEIGGNKILLESGSQGIFFDFGLGFASSGMYYDNFLSPRTNNILFDLIKLNVLPNIKNIYREDLIHPKGMDKLLPGFDLQGQYLWQDILGSHESQKSTNLKGVFLSHAHIDHSQFISLIDENTPIYTSKVTHKILRMMQETSQSILTNEFVDIKLRFIDEIKSKNSFFPGSLVARSGEPTRRNIVDLTPLQSVRAGDFLVTPINVDHSVLGAMAFFAEIEGKTIFYSGDLRFHGIRDDWTQLLFEELDKRKPDVMIVEGTRINEEDRDDEREVLYTISSMVSQWEGLAIVSFAWKDTTRFLTLYQVAKNTGRVLVISHKLAYLIKELGVFPDLGLPNIDDDPNVKVYLKRSRSLMYSPSDYINSKIALGYESNWLDKDNPDITHLENGVRAYHVHENPSKYIIHLDLFDFNELIDIDPPSGTNYVRATSEPFDEEGEMDEKRIINWLARFDINKSLDHKPLYIHASGHASGKEIANMINEVMPDKLVPIHTLHPESFKGLLDKNIEVILPEVGKPVRV